MRPIHVFALILVACGSDKSSQIDANADIDGPGGDIDAPGTGIDAADDPDAPGGGSGVACGTMTCTSGMDCCVTFSGGGGGGGGSAMYDCIAGGTTCGGISTSCDGPEDCATAGDRCCGTGGGGSGGIQCVGSAATCYLERCHGPADCADAGDMCCNSQFIGQYCAAMCF